MSEAPLIAGVEVGGTKCIVLLGRGPEDIVEQVRIETRDPDSTLGDIDAVLERWHEAHGFAAIGIASFGPVDLHPSSATYGSIVSTPKPGWSGTPLVSRWRRFGVPIGFEIDVIAAARAEQRWGSAAGLQDFAYITVGTGLGVGPIIGDKPVLGRGHCEMGHIHIPRLAEDDWPGVCPYHGDCVEGLACGVAIAARHGPGDVAPDWHGWVTVEHALAMLVHNLFVTLQPRRVLIGGGVAVARPQLIDAVRARAEASLAQYYSAAALEDGWLAEPGLGAMAGPLGAIAVGLAAAVAD